MQSPIHHAIHVGCFQFFRIRLLTSSPEEIEKIIDKNDKEIESIKSDTLKMCWHMRGGLTYNEAMNLSYSEKKIIGSIIKENIETTKKTGLNWF